MQVRVPSGQRGDGSQGSAARGHATLHSSQLGHRPPPASARHKGLSAPRPAQDSPGLSRERLWRCQRRTGGELLAASLLSGLRLPIFIPSSSVQPWSLAIFGGQIAQWKANEMQSLFFMFQKEDLLSGLLAVSTTQIRVWWKGIYKQA